jgi:hypothetical protein
MRRAWALLALLLLLPSWAPSARAHEGCSIHSIAGTWGFGAYGRSVIADPTLDPASMHFMGLYLPGAFAGRVKILPNGTFNGYYWLNIGGGLFASATAIPFAGPVKVNGDCTGEWSYPVSLSPSDPPVTVVERFAILDEGREIRSISWTTGIPTFTWTLVAKRIPRACTPRRVSGSYAMQCHGHAIIPGLPAPLPDTALLSTAALLRFEVDRHGVVAGRFMEKIGPFPLDTEFSGSFDVAPDCSVLAEFTLPGLGQAEAVGILVEDASRGYGLPLLLTAEDDEPVPEQAVFCELGRVKAGWPGWRPKR